MMQIQETALNLVNGNGPQKIPNPASNAFYEKLKEARDAVQEQARRDEPLKAKDALPRETGRVGEEPHRKDEIPGAHREQRVPGDRESSAAAEKAPGANPVYQTVTDQATATKPADMLYQSVTDQSAERVSETSLSDLFSHATVHSGTLADQSAEIVSDTLLLSQATVRPGTLTDQSARLAEESLLSDESAFADATLALGEDVPVEAEDALTKLGEDAKAKKNKTGKTDDLRDRLDETLVDMAHNANEINPAAQAEQTIDAAAAFSADAFAQNSDYAVDGVYKGKKIAGLEHTAIRVVDERGEKSVTMDVNLGAAGIGNGVNNGNTPDARSGTGAATGTSFDRLLQAELQKNAGELVKVGQIVLQNNDVGTIRLVLHPESLGNVKINLRLNEGRVTGSIACGSEEAYRALKETIPSLEQAFKQSGFETNGFDLSWGRGNDGSGQNAQGHTDRSPHPQDFAAASTEYVRGLPEALSIGSESAQNRAVNLVA